MMGPDDTEPGAGSLSDILFGSLAVLLALVFLLLPLAGVATVGREVEVELKIDGRDAPILRLDAEGLSYESRGEERRVAVDNIFNDPAFGADLRRWGAAGQVPILLVRPDGHEALFMTESRAAGENLAAIGTVRVGADGDCRHVDAAWARRAPGLCDLGKDAP